MGSLSVVGRQRLMMPLRKLGIVFVAGKRQGDGFHGDRKSNFHVGNGELCIDMMSLFTSSRPMLRIMYQKIDCNVGLPL